VHPRKSLLRSSDRFSFCFVAIFVLSSEI